MVGLDNLLSVDWVVQTPIHVCDGWSSPLSNARPQVHVSSIVTGCAKACMAVAVSYFNKLHLKYLNFCFLNINYRIVNLSKSYSFCLLRNFF